MEQDLGFSLVLLKPECRQCGVGDLIEKFEELVKGKVITSKIMNLDMDTAKELWANVKEFPWAQAYYEAMAGMVQVYVLRGEETGLRVKKDFRKSNAELIARLTKDCPGGYSPDLIHASDPGEQQREMDLLGLTAIAALNI